MRLSHLRSPVPATGPGTTLGLLSKYLLNSRWDQTGTAPILAWGQFPVETESPDPGFHSLLNLTLQQPSEARRTQASATFRHCFPSDAFDCWFYSSPFSLSVLENHKETPRCSWNSCQRDSSRIERTAPSFHTNRGVATSSAAPSFCQPGLPGEGGIVRAWLATHESPGLAGSPSSHPRGAPGVACGMGCKINTEVRWPSGNNPDTHCLLIPTHPQFSKPGLFSVSSWLCDLG